MQTYNNNDWRTYLEHHQIKGAKWGVKHGPPYPLNRDQLSSEQKRLGGVSESAKEKYGDYSKTKAQKYKSKETGSFRIGETDTRDVKYTIDQGVRRKIREALTGAGRKFIYSELMSKNPTKLQIMLRDVMQKVDKRTLSMYPDFEWEAVEERVDKEGNKHYFNTAKVLENDPNTPSLRKPTYELSPDNFSKIVADARQVNPDFRSGDFGAHCNCPFASTALAMRLKGYDVSARLSFDGSDDLAYKYWFDNAKFVNNVDSKEANSFFDKVDGGSYGTIGFSGEICGEEYGHVINWVKTTDGKTTFIDAQSITESRLQSKFDSLDQLNEVVGMKLDGGIWISDLTNATPNFKNMAVDSVITPNQTKSLVKYRNTYNDQIVDVFDKAGREEEWSWRKKH